MRLMLRGFMKTRILPGLLRLGVLTVLGPTVLSGCGLLRLDPSGSSGDAPALAPLPDPAGGWVVVFPARTPAQEKKWGEGQQRAAKWYKDQSYVVVTTTQTSRSGDLIDWLDETSVAGSDAPPPPPMPSAALVLPEGVQREQMELDDPAEARGPAGTIPFLRPLFWEYVYEDTGATSLDDWVQHHQVIGDPSGGEQYLYAGIDTAMANRGAAVSINSFQGPIELLSQSVQEMVVGCRAGKKQMWQWVGIASSRKFMRSCSAADAKVDASACDDQTTRRLRAEFLTGGAKLTGNNVGGWNDTAIGFVPARGIPYPLGASFDDRTLSTVGGTQYESLYQVELKDDGNWWVGHNGHWLGYFPSTLFGDGTFTKQACVAQWYAEVYAALTDPSWPIGASWTWTDMSSGHFAEEGFSNAGYFRNPAYLTPDGSGTWSFPPMDPTVTIDVTPYNPACYTRTPPQTGASPWDLFFYADGPGSDNPSCK